MNIYSQTTYRQTCSSSPVRLVQNMEVVCLNIDMLDWLNVPNVTKNPVMPIGICTDPFHSRHFDLRVTYINKHSDLFMCPKFKSIWQWASLKNIKTMSQRQSCGFYAVHCPASCILPLIFFLFFLLWVIYSQRTRWCVDPEEAVCDSG